MEPLRTLIVDDAAPLRELLRLQLMEEGGDRFEVVGEAANGAQAIELARELRPDLIILDLLMPVVDGFQALPELRRIVPDARIVCLTAAVARTRAEASELGADLVLDKTRHLHRIVDYL